VSRHARAVSRGVVVAVCAALALPATRGTAQTPARAADLDRFYSAPSLIGTAPRAPVWSRDGQRLAFLWNTDGTNFLDVFVTDARGTPPTRITRFARTPRAAGDTTTWAVQRAALAAELDGGVSTVTWHPDGARLLVTFRGDLWLAAPGAEPLRLTDTRSTESRAAFAPGPAIGDSAALAFVRDGDVWIATLRGTTLGDPRRLTRHAKDGVSIESAVWAPDGSRLAIVEVDRTGIRTRGIPDYLGDETMMPMVRRAMPGEDSEHRRVGIVDRATGTTRWLTIDSQPTDALHGLTWSPDGTQLAVDWSDVFVKDRRILVADAHTGAVRTLVREQEPMNISAEWQIAWAPDGRGVYFTSDRAVDYHVWYAPVGAGAPRAITSGAWAVFGMQVTARGLFIVGNPERPEERHLLRVPLSGGAAVHVSAAPGTHTPVVSPDGRYAADLFSSDSVPPDLYVIDVAARPRPTTARVTASPLAEFAQYRFTAPRYVSFPSRADGATLHARLLLPPGYVAGRRYPVIVGSSYSNTARNQWGGRNAHPLWGLDQVLLERGFVLIGIDVAGSSGHGTAFRRRIRLDYGGIDVEDLHSGVEYLVREGIADSTRVGIWGSSYGGLLTTMSLFTKPAVYRAGVAGAPATNVWHALTGEQRVMMRPQEQPDQYRNASSHTKAAGLRGHLMLIHGMRDVVVLYKDSAWLAQYLLQLGHDVELVTLPDAGHGWDLEGLAQTRFAFRKLVNFFERHLGGTVR
jgi:dipeptidyl-peptidase-4